MSLALLRYSGSLSVVNYGSWFLRTVYHFPTTRLVNAPDFRLDFFCWDVETFSDAVLHKFFIFFSRFVSDFGYVVNTNVCLALYVVNVVFKVVSLFLRMIDARGTKLLSMFFNSSLKLATSYRYTRKSVTSLAISLITVVVCQMFDTSTQKWRQVFCCVCNIKKINSFCIIDNDFHTQVFKV